MNLSDEDDCRSVVELLQTPGRLKLLDSVLTEADPGDERSKSRIASEAGVSRTTVVSQIGGLVEYGVIETVGEERSRYTPNIENSAYDLFQTVNAELAKNVR